MTTRVLLVDDHKILREALGSVLERENDLALIGEASEGDEALRLSRELKPDVVVMDIGLPLVSGIEVTRRLLRDHPDIRVLALSTFSDRRIVLQMLDAGASGYIVKSAGRDELLRGIRSLAQGRTYICPEVAAIVVDSVRGRKPTQRINGERLGRREREVLQLLADGRTSPEIAGTLHIATSTVEVHRRNIMRKLDLHSVAELTKYAIRNGLTTA
ncbi:response regulator transcription factor [Rhodocyclus tenuis]|uniref:Response regulator n=2 Tax=Rhodocyclus TaxID=1064 RepID=A0A6L5JTA5_RHOTE|nr:response regulator transcription factor [Rhodocyclus gracilis]MQY50625.1 response regulator [Rhodocyclus gracilis]MRD72629.1 response regulator [Rhodocyclus gracilis]NJA88155.1 response regulator transcription factor [Rhodocyclus gracilis]